MIRRSFKKTHFAACLGIILSVGTSLSAISPKADFSFDKEPENLLMNNRVLLKINGKPISVMDVTRKMDLLFYKQYPELTSSAVARYQFYTSAWDTVLNLLIDDHLIMADAEEKKIEISDGEVREELEQLFGPNVVLNLDKLEMTLEEAFDLLKTDLLVQRMIGMMVRSKAQAELLPKDMRARYEKKIKETPLHDALVYQIVSIRGEGHQSVAEAAHKLLHEQEIPIEQLTQSLEYPKTVKVSLSEEYRRKNNELSLAHKAILQALQAGMASAPIVNNDTSRIFYLKKFEKAEHPSFKAMEDRVKGELINEIVQKHDQAYRKKLRDHYGVTTQYLRQAIPDNLKPFALK